MENINSTSLRFANTENTVMRACEGGPPLQPARPGSHRTTLSTSPPTTSRLDGVHTTEDSQDFTVKPIGEKGGTLPLAMAALDDSPPKRLGKKGQRKRDANKGQRERKESRRREDSQGKEGNGVKQKAKKTGKSKSKTSPRKSALNPGSLVRLKFQM